MTPHQVSLPWAANTVRLIPKDKISGNLNGPNTRARCQSTTGNDKHTAESDGEGTGSEEEEGWILDCDDEDGSSWGEQEYCEEDEEGNIEEENDCDDYSDEKEDNDDDEEEDYGEDEYEEDDFVVADHDEDVNCRFQGSYLIDSDDD
ncbi:hypothetical protein OIDMADRAFT_61444 [Oidiodendron maius Zn]|uniref:Uncharacterized protein n=1 Tax=Oidiodendron maius (strain Zn) TaxID=913774 RepID=A0A0C3GBF0_OIDMZ|nr:hypothetical protein OIDMADRAFT_61444 [Oidiodendron maius Zn]